MDEELTGKSAPYEEEQTEETQTDEEKHAVWIEEWRESSKTMRKQKTFLQGLALAFYVALSVVGGYLQIRHFHTEGGKISFFIAGVCACAASVGLIVYWIILLVQRLKRAAPQNEPEAVLDSVINRCPNCSKNVVWAVGAEEYSRIKCPVCNLELTAEKPFEEWHAETQWTVTEQGVVGDALAVGTAFDMKDLTVFF